MSFFSRLFGWGRAVPPHQAEPTQAEVRAQLEIELAAYRKQYANLESDHNQWFRGQGWFKLSNDDSYWRHQNHMMDVSAKIKRLENHLAWISSPSYSPSGTGYSGGNTDHWSGRASDYASDRGGGNYGTSSDSSGGGYGTSSDSGGGGYGTSSDGSGGNSD